MAMRICKDLRGITQLLKPETATRLINAGKVVKRNRGDVIFHKGEPGDSTMVILSGTIKIWNITSCGREVIFDFMTPGEIMGEVSIIDGGERTANATCMSNAQLFSIPQPEILQIMMDDPEVLMLFARATTKKLRECTIKIEDDRNSVPMRIMLSLLRLSELVGQPKEDGIAIAIPVNQYELANYVGVSRSNFSKIVSELQRIGAVDKTGDETMTVNEKVLRRQLACVDCAG
ncbi:MAG: Crp/Fnr family transcriptional regulator [Pseudomonadota bacterium]